MKEEIFGETLNILKELDEIRDDIKGYERKHGESVEKSLSILADMKSNLFEKGFRIYLSYLIENAKTEENLDSIHFLATMVKKNIETLKLFVLSEIVHRKILELKFKLTHPFFFKELKRTLGNIELDLEELDEKASAEEKRGDIGERIKNYGDIIKRTKSLEKTIWEEKKSGLLGYLKFLFGALIAGFGWLLYIFGYLQTDFRFYYILGAILLFLVLFPVLLLTWNYVSYGIKILHNRSIIIILILCYSFFVILYCLVSYSSEQTILDLRNFLFPIFLILSPAFFSCISSYNQYKKSLSKEMIYSIFNRFFPQEEKFFVLAKGYKDLDRNCSIIHGTSLFR